MEGRQFTSVAFAALHAVEQEAHGDETKEYVETVKTGRDVEDRTVRVRVPAGRQVDPLVDLVGDKDGTHSDGDPDPALGLGALTVLLEPDGPLHRARRRHQDDGEDAGLQRVEFGAGRRPNGDVCTDSKQRGEETGEEHQLRTEPDHHTDGQHRWTVVNDLVLLRQT